jgi:hypothetical protein
MSDDHVRTAGRLDHRTRNFAGERTLFRPVEILCANLYPRSTGSRNGGFHIEERWADHDLAMSGTFYQRPKAFEERRGSVGSLYIFQFPPIAGARFFMKSILKRLFC